MVDIRHIHKLESTNIYWKWAILTYIYLRLIVMSKRSQEVKVRDVLSYKFIWPKRFDLKLTSAMADRNPSLLKQNDVELSAPQHSHILWFTPPSVTQYSVSCVMDHNHCSLMHVTPPSTHFSTPRLICMLSVSSSLLKTMSCDCCILECAWCLLDSDWSTEDTAIGLNGALVPMLQECLGRLCVPGGRGRSK